MCACPLVSFSCAHQSVLAGNGCRSNCIIVRTKKRVVAICGLDWMGDHIYIQYVYRGGLRFWKEFFQKQLVLFLRRRPVSMETGLIFCTGLRTVSSETVRAARVKINIPCGFRPQAQAATHLQFASLFCAPQMSAEPVPSREHRHPRALASCFWCVNEL